jgi:Uma2 family endonuclease
MMKLFAGLVRIPDVAFASWDRLPGGKVPSEPVPLLAPDLAIEILSPSNTPQEMARKRREYFSAGVRLVWIIDLDARTASIYTAPEPPLIVSESQSIDGGSVLPGFVLPLRGLFAELDRQA